MAWTQWMSQPPGQKHEAVGAGRLRTPVLLIFGAVLTAVRVFLAGVTIWAPPRTLPVISGQPALRPQGAAADLGPESAPGMSDIPSANPAYPAPPEERLPRQR